MSARTWRGLVAEEMATHGETWADMTGSVIAKPERYYEDDGHTPSFDREFDAGYGGSEGDRFTVWTEKRVYFPIVYDGAEWCGSAPRNPCDEACAHQGGQ